MHNKTNQSELTDLDFVNAYTTLSMFLGKKMPWPSFKELIQRHSAEGIFYRCTQIASELANHSDYSSLSNIQQEAYRIAKSWFFHPNLALHIIGTGSKHRTEFNVFHEQILLFLQASAVAFGASRGPVPGNESMVMLALAANDYLPDFIDKSETSAEDWLVATIFLIGRYNLTPDAVSQLLRPYMILRQKPRRGKFNKMSDWITLQKQAFGIAFDEYFNSFAAPLFINSHMWNAREIGSNPIINSQDYFAHTKLGSTVGAQFLEELTQTAAQSRTSIIEGMINGIPHDWTCFLRRPFVRFASNRLIPVSPWAVRNQLNLGFWHRFLNAAKIIDDKEGAESWFSTFGDLFEEWCQNVARKVEDKLPSNVRLITPERLSDPNEIEDVVLIGDDCAILFSVKGKIIPEEPSRTSESVENILQWLNHYLFSNATKRYRGGAIRLLDNQIQKLKRGDFSPRVPHNLSVIPVLVTYDRIPDEIITCRWIHKNCLKLGLLGGDDVAPLTLMGPDEYESVWGLASHGVNIIDLFKLRFQEKYRYARWSVLVKVKAAEDKMQRPDWLEDEFNHLHKKIEHTLFGNQ